MKLQLSALSKFATAIFTTLTLSAQALAASPTADAFSKQIMLGVKVSTTLQNELPVAERQCVINLPDTVLGSEFDEIFHTQLTPQELVVANTHYDSELAKQHFDWFAKRTWFDATGSDSEKAQIRSAQPIEAVSYMNAFAESDIGQKTMAVLQDQDSMVTVKKRVLGEIHQCRLLYAN